MRFILPLVALLLITFYLSLSLGTQWIPVHKMAQIGNTHFHEIVFSIRLPRAINAITIGALLSVSGLMIQNLVKNPLADPYILGLSGASASTQILILAFGITVSLFQFVFIGFIAAILSMALLMFISSRKVFNPSRLLLTGVVLSFAYGAIISMTLTLSPLSTTKPILFWLMGDLSYSSHSLYSSLILFAGMLLVFPFHRELDLLARGEFFAKKSGVDVRKINTILIFITALFTAIAVSMAGTIGFIGLIVPHIARLLVGNIHAMLIPLSALIGAIVLLIADTASRTLFAPVQLPVGIFTAFLGIPIFLYLLHKKV